MLGLTAIYPLSKLKMMSGIIVVTPLMSTMRPMSGTGTLGLEIKNPLYSAFVLQGIRILENGYTGMSITAL